ncbi:FeoA family protein [Desulfocucumis palustris]|uniref:FeoA family protein n=1 Tax=Desulfocucumis palustris TaxID=1898651 RepID=A0A2L2XDP0_9FIRM|nr:ferrous iron transport protein A [Desulfocucumis palustris]GBF34479.1 FeoA family protein [Desulfocucumis palustris]
MTLDSVKRGQRVKILSIPDDMIRTQAIRFGIAEGAVVTCREIVPAGPVVISLHNQEIAIGRKLAKNIMVEAVVSSPEKALPDKIE